MSSHHFVKEGQEPALFILEPLPFHLSGPLLEWAPLVVVSNNALETVLQWGIKIDIVMAEDSHIGMAEHRLFEQAPVKILLHQPGESPMSKALYFLLSSNQTGVNIITSAAEEVFTQADVFIHQLQINLCDKTLKWSAIPSGNFEKWLPHGTKLRIRKSLSTQSFQSRGLTEKEDGFESTADGIINISSDQSFWVAEPHA